MLVAGVEDSAATEAEAAGGTMTDGSTATEAEVAVAKDSTDAEIKAAVAQSCTATEAEAASGTGKEDVVVRRFLCTRLPCQVIRY